MSPSASPNATAMLAATTQPPAQPPPRTFIGRPGHSLSPSLEGFENHSSSLPVLSQSSSVRREIGMERHLSECPGLEEDHEWELPGEHPERYLPECPGPEEGPSGSCGSVPDIQRDTCRSVESRAPTE